MRFDRARTIADAVMMEGDALYPYRAAAPKNRYRWAFGALAPRAWSEAGGGEPWWLEAQVLVAGTPTRIAGQLRFFHLERRRPEDADSRAVASLDDGSRLVVASDEGMVETINFDVPLDDEREHVFALDPLIAFEPHGTGRVIRERRELTGRLVVRGEPITAEQPLARVAIRVENTTPWSELAAVREDVIASAFASTHLLIGVDGGELLSAIAPPPWAETAAATCTSTGTYPVLVGSPGSGDVVLAAPFVMHDHPDAGERVPEYVVIGAKVRLRPAVRRAEAQDLLFAGHVATVAAIRHDVDGSTFLAVTVDDDPAAEGWVGRVHYYRTDEVDPL